MFGQIRVNGMIYYQQTRTCNKPGCKCKHGKPHGPYWYSRDELTGQVRYVGKNLPDAVAQERERQNAARETLRELRGDLATLQQLVDTLAMYVGGGRLNEDEQKLVARLLAESDQQKAA